MDKNNLFKSYELKTGAVHVANWGDREWSIREVSADAIDKMGKAKGEIAMAVTAIIDGVTTSEGRQYFNEGDRKKLLMMSIKDLILVSSAILKLSDLDK